MTISRNLSILAEGVSASGVLAVTNGGTGVTTSTGTGNVVLSASPSLTGTLDVNGTVRSKTSTGGTVNMDSTTTSTTNTIGSYANSGAAFADLNYSAAAHIWLDSGSEKMRIDSSGNVGIGTASPAEAFNVKRGAGVSAYAEFAGNNNTLGTTSVLYGQDSGSNGYFYNRANAPVIFGTNNTERMRIDASGNAGIGTASPNASAILDAQSTTKGVRFPNMTTTQKNAVSSPAAGLVVFDTTLSKLCVYSGSAWQTITSV